MSVNRKMEHFDRLSDLPDIDMCVSTSAHIKLRYLMPIFVWFSMKHQLPYIYKLVYAINGDVGS